MKTKILATTLLLLVMLVMWFALEGLLAVINFGQPAPSLTFSLFNALDKGPAPGKAPDQLPPQVEVITDETQIVEMLPDMLSAGVALGNSPYNELKTDSARTGTEIDGCKVQKPNLRKVMGFLRTTLFDRFDPINAFYTVDQPMPDRLKLFLDKYMFRKASYTTDENGYRTTIPAVRTNRKVLVAGASIAAGLLLDDSETVASQMQQRDPSRQYVNLGIGGGGNMKDIVCSLERAEKSYPAQIDEVVYILGEIQQNASEPYGTAEELIPWLQKYVARNGIKQLDFVYIPYIYNAMPDVTRRAGDKRFEFSYYTAEKKSFLDGAKSAGFRVVDFLEASDSIRQDSGNQFAGLIYYLDASHLSKVGTKKLIEMLTDR